MKLLHITSITNPKGNGVATAVINYLKYESKYAKVALYNMESNLNIENIKNYNLSKYNKLKNVIEDFSKPDLVIFNEIYKMEYLKIYKECLKYNIPYVIIPHGCLIKTAQRKKLFKKIVANYLFFNNFIKNAKALQFLNKNEKDNSIFNNKEYIISGNGIEIPSVFNKYTNKNFIYIGRYDLKVKGLDLLIKTCANNKEWFLTKNIKIKMYGRKSGKGFNKILNDISKYGLGNIIDVMDPVYNKEKEEILLTSYCFIQVSRHEGQPLGIMEALSYGLPCIVTYGTSFGEYVNKNNCGIGINFSEKELFEAIKKMYNDVNFRKSCSHNSNIVNIDFESNSIILELLKKYNNIIQKEVK